MERGWWSVEFDLKLDGKKISWIELDEASREHVLDCIKNNCWCGELCVETDEDNIVDATFTSVWDGGYEITTNCKVNLDTKEIFDIEPDNCDIDVDVLDREFVTINEVDYPASCDGTTEYWYE